MRWPNVAGLKWSESAFVGAFHPSRALHVDLIERPASAGLRIECGDGWFLAATESPAHPADTGMIHRSDGAGVAFRGYLTDPPLHTWSPSSRIVERWLPEAGGPFNGVFAAAVVESGRRRAALCTDALGLGPIYYRVIDGALLFASNARLLARKGDEPDLIAWRSFLECGSMACDRAMSAGVSRVPAGSVVSFDTSGIRTRAWLDFDALPGGTRALDDAAFREIEDRFRNAVDRCLQLDNGRVVLPFSSGYDSRRIFGELHRRGTPFEAVTARVFQKSDRDLDAPYAARMAKDFGVPHTIVEPASPPEYAVHDLVRTQLLDWESGAHTWVVRVSESLPAEPGIVFDGVLGDVLGNPGFRMAGLYESRQRDLDLILAALYGGAFDRLLAEDRWPSLDEVKDDLRRYLRPWSARLNLAEFAFLLMRQRRMTSPWCQQLLPGGYLPVNPYADLDYISLLLEFAPAAKHATPVQGECLSRFAPDLFGYPGNRSVPTDSIPVGARYARETALACHRLLRRRLGASGFSAARKWCGSRGRLMLRASHWNSSAAMRWSWFARPVLGLVLREREFLDVWSLAASPEPREARPADPDATGPRRARGPASS